MKTIQPSKKFNFRTAAHAYYERPRQPRRKTRSQ